MAVKKLTIKEIAKLSGISVSTVSRAINNHYDISPETKRRVQEIIDQYGYVPNNSARNLKLNDARNIAVLVKGITNPFFTSMIKVFEKECSDHDYALVLEHVEEEQDETELAALLEKEKRLNGLIFLGGNPVQSVERLKRLTVPFVFCSVAVPDRKAFAEYSYVAIDDRAEAEKVTDYLIEQGRKRIALLSDAESDISNGMLRLEGYLHSLEKHGIEPDPALICRPISIQKTYTYENGYQRTVDLIQSGTKFDAIFAIADSIAIGCLRALRDQGIRVPEDVAVIGFDGLEIGHYLTPALSTLQQPVDEMAEASMHALLGLLEEREKEVAAKLAGGSTAEQQDAARKVSDGSAETSDGGASKPKEKKARFQQIFPGELKIRESC